MRLVRGRESRKEVIIFRHSLRHTMWEQFVCFDRKWDVLQCALAVAVPFCALLPFLAFR